MAGPMQGNYGDDRDVRDRSDNQPVKMTGRAGKEPSYTTGYADQLDHEIERLSTFLDNLEAKVHPVLRDGYEGDEAKSMSDDEPPVPDLPRRLRDQGKMVSRLNSRLIDLIERIDL